LAFDRLDQPQSVSAIAAHRERVEPVDIKPLIGLGGVLIAATMSQFNDQVTSIALTDIRGALGIGRDAGTWIESLYVSAEIVGLAISPTLLMIFTLRRTKRDRKKRPTPQRFQRWSRPEAEATEAEAILEEAILVVPTSPAVTLVASTTAGPMSTLAMFMSSAAAASAITAGTDIGATPTPHAIHPTWGLILTAIGRNDAVQGPMWRAVTHEPLLGATSG
jgi:hypothetical protein